MIKSFKPFEKEEKIFQKGEKVVLVETKFTFIVNVTLGKVYTITKDSDPKSAIWIKNNIGLDGGYMSRSYTFKRLTEVRKEKILKITNKKKI